jgi:hypothetical protein
MKMTKTKTEDASRNGTNWMCGVRRLLAGNRPSEGSDPYRTADGSLYFEAPGRGDASKFVVALGLEGPGAFDMLVCSCYIRIVLIHD